MFIAYNDGCGIGAYDSNQIIEEIYDIIDDVFITEGQRKTVVKQPAVSGTGGTESLVEASSDVTYKQGFFSGLLSGTVFQAAPITGKLMDEIRRGYHKNIYMMNDN